MTSTLHAEYAEHLRRMRSLLSRLAFLQDKALEDDVLEQLREEIAAVRRLRLLGADRRPANAAVEEATLPAPGPLASAHPNRSN